MQPLPSIVLLWEEAGSTQGPQVSDLLSVLGCTLPLQVDSCGLIPIPSPPSVPSVGSLIISPLGVQKQWGPAFPEDRGGRDIVKLVLFFFSFC